MQIRRTLRMMKGSHVFRVDLTATVPSRRSSSPCTERTLYSGEHGMSYECFGYEYANRVLTIEREPQD